MMTKMITNQLSDEFDSDLEEDEKRVQDRDNNYFGSSDIHSENTQVKKSILKSKLLTNQRTNKFDKINNLADLDSSHSSPRKNQRSFKERLPVRHPSKVDFSQIKSRLNSKTLSIKDLNQMRKSKSMSTEMKSFEYMKSHNKSDHENLNSFLSKSLNTNRFQIVWAIALFLAHTYNMITFWYYTGVNTFPTGVLLLIQILFEFILVIDFVLRLCLYYFAPEIWISIWFLHDYYSFSTKVGISLNWIASIPLMFIIACSTRDTEILHSVWIAILRFPKLLRFREVNKILSTLSKLDNRSSWSVMYILTVAYPLFIATHIIGCIWLITGRVDPESPNWYDMDNFSHHPSDIEKYTESIFFSVSTMGGMGFGNIVPRTYLEYIIDILIMIVGCSIYASFFANFVVVLNRRNAKKIESLKNYEHTKDFGLELNIDRLIMTKIRYFYNTLHIDYNDMYEKYWDLRELPISLRTELSIIWMSANLIKKIKLFQFSHPMFILSFVRAMMPKICMADDYVVEVGDIADEMYFIKNGLVKVLATDNKTTIAYLSEGGYFGEIGLLLTGTRSWSVKAKTIWILYSISKEDLFDVLNRFPEQKDFLKAVGKQRLETTNPEDLDDRDEDSNDDSLENNKLLDELSNREAFISNDKFAKRVSFALAQNSNIKHQNISKHKRKWWTTKQYPIDDQFIIIPFSKFFYVWILIMIIACCYTLFIVPFAIAFEYSYHPSLYAIDIISLLVFWVDILIVSRTAFNKEFEIIIDLKSTIVDYMDTRFFIDMISIIPLDYILMIFSASQQAVAFGRLIRLLKLYKLLDYIRIWRKHSNFKIALFTLFLLSILFIILSHIGACIFFYIGKYELDHHRRYDGQTLFSNAIDRNFLTLSPFMEMSIIERYWHWLYLSSWILGAVIYGDMIPLTLREQYFGLFLMFVGRIFLSFVFAEAASYLSSVHSTYSNHIKVRNTVIKYLEYYNLPIKLKKRVNKYHEILWNNFKGINENEILSHLPSSIQKQIKFSLFSDLVNNVTLFPKDDRAAISALISRLNLQLISEDEYVIKEGEIADWMYFILRGSVNVIKNGVILATLEKGANFGEMALAARKPTIRNASALCVTHVSVGSLSITNFNVICKWYPIFESKIKDEVMKRQKDLEEKTCSKMQRDLHSTKNIKEGDSLSTIKESEYTEIKRNSVKSENRRSKFRSNNSGSISLPKDSRAQMYKLNEPDSEDNPVTNFLNQLTQTVEIKPFNRNLKPILKHPNDNMNNNTIKIDFKDEEEIEEVLEESHLKLKSNHHYEESESFDVNASHKSDKVSSGSKSRSSSKLSLQNNGLAEVKSVNQKWVFIRKIINYITLLQIFQSWLLILVMYNIVFVPLQAGFQLDYSGGYIFMETLTLLFYFIDILYIFIRHRKAKSILNKLNQKDNEYEILKSNLYEEERKKIRSLRIEMIFAILSCLPFSIILWSINIEEPYFIVFFVKMLRLAKILPILNITNFFKKKALNVTRIIEMLFFYYLASHIIAWSFICIAYSKPDIMDTWLRKLPVPQMTGMRTEPGLEGLSNSSIYAHSLFFVVNTISHVAVGDISMISAKERTYNAFIIFCGTFIYAFLFGNIASIMADFSPHMFYFKFHKEYEEVMNSWNKEAVPAHLVNKIKDYFEYVWTSSKGISYTEFLNELPKWLNADILRARYIEAIKNSIIFKNDKDAIDHALVNSILTSLEYRVYMDWDFIVIGGSISQNTYLIMEGQAVVFGFNGEFISLIKSGGHYSNDLDPNDENLHNYKRPIHILSSGISIVGVISKFILNDLYIAFPHLKEKLRCLNKQFAKFTQKHLKQYLDLKMIEYNTENALKAITDHYSYSDQTVYNKLKEKVSWIDLESEEIQKHDIIIKQKAIIMKYLTKRIINIINPRGSSEFKQVGIYIDSSKQESWCSKFQFRKNSRYRKIIDCVHLINLMYISTSIPLYIGFDIKMGWELILIEILSIIISAANLTINIRTPVILRSGATIDFKKVIKHYYHNGLIFDMIALWPLNLILGAADVIYPIWLITPIRLFRMITIHRIIDIFGTLEKYFKKYTLLVTLIKSSLFIGLVLHGVGWLWYWINEFVEPNSDYTWAEYNELTDAPLSKKIVLWYYTVINIAATVGSGDIFPMTDLERLFFVFMISLGDAVFASAFGLLAGITLQASSNSSTDQFFQKMYSIKELLRQNNGDKNQETKVEQFFAYSWHLYKSTDMISIKSLSSKLPYRLSKEVVYYSTKHLLEPMFKQFGSENLIKDVSRVLEQSIYLPGDFIILKDDIGEEMYFIAEGTVYILAADKRTVLNTLNRGAYFGEMAIFLGLNKRTAYVQAETFCSLLILKKSDLDNIKANYPTVAEDIKNEARKRAYETKAIEKKTVQKSSNYLVFHRPDLDQYKTPPGYREKFFEDRPKSRSKRNSFESQVVALLDNESQNSNSKPKNNILKT